LFGEGSTCAGLLGQLDTLIDDANRERKGSLADVEWLIFWRLSAYVLWHTLSLGWM
jgi:hypothetical protein